MPLLELEPDLAAGLSDTERENARRLVVVSTARVPAGPWTPADGLAQVFATLLLSGFVIHDSTSFGRPAVQLFGPGDVIDARLLVDTGSAWRVLRPAQTALLDDRFILAARHWPALMKALARRLLDAHHEQHIVAAIASIPRVEERVLALLSHLAGRWGHVTPKGVTLDLPLTHALLGQLVGARRPTISLALGTLHEEELLRRLSDGKWLLPRDCNRWHVAGLPSTASTASAA